MPGSRVFVRARVSTSAGTSTRVFYQILDYYKKNHHLLKKIICKNDVYGTYVMLYVDLK